MFVALMVTGTSALASTPNAIYVVAKRVDMIPNEANATEVVIYGNFTLYQGNDAGAQYGEVTCGYMHFRCKSGEEATCRMQWSELKASIATPACKGIGQQSVVSTATLHPMGAPLGTPDVYDIGNGLAEASSLGGKCPVLKSNTCNVTVSSDAGVTPADTSAADTKPPSTSDTGSAAIDTGTAVTDTGSNACTSSSDCPSGRYCVAGHCTFMDTARCSEDGHQVIAVNGTITVCEPYLCSNGLCNTRCVSNDDCNAGTSCEGNACVSPKVAAADDGGCAFGPRGMTATGGAIALALAAFARMIRRRRK